MKKLLFFVGILLATANFVYADAVTFEASVDSSKVSIDEVIQLTLTFNGLNQDIDPITLPTMEGFTSKYLGPSTNVSIVNGVYSSSRSFVYNLFPEKVGKFQIPAITATIAGQTYTTKPIDIDVAQSSAQAQPSNQAANQDQGPTADSLKDKVLIQVSVAQHDVFLNQRIPVTINLLVNGVPVRDIQYPQFDKTGFTVDDFDKPEQSTEVVNGVNYDTVEFKTNIYPQHLGDVTFGPVQIQGSVLYKARQQNPFNQDNNPFGSDIFGGFFDTYATRPITLTTQPIVLHVSALPDANQPSDYTGAIGQFDFKASVSPREVKVGDPLTLKMDIKGDGDFKNLKMPVFHGDGFKTYEPQIKDLGGEKTAEEVIIPTTASIKQVPALEFSYFDTELKDYKTITQGPFDIQVTAPNADQEFKAVGFTDISHESTSLHVNPLSFDQLFLKATQFLKMLFDSMWFRIGTGIFLITGIFYFLWQRFQERLDKDPAFARRFKALRVAKKTLSEAEGYIPAGQSKDFYALISRALREYLANKWDQPSTLGKDEILAQLKSAQVNEILITQMRILIEQSDLVCFAGAPVDAIKMRADMAKTQELIADLEKVLK